MCPVEVDYILGYSGCSVLTLRASLVVVGATVCLGVSVWPGARV